MAAKEILGEPTEDIAALYKQEAAEFSLLSAEEERRLGRDIERGKITSMLRQAIDQRENGFVPFVASEVMTTRVLVQTGLSPYIVIVASEKKEIKEKKQTEKSEKKHVVALSETIGGFAVVDWQEAHNRLADSNVRAYFDKAAHDAQDARKQFITANLRLVPKIAVQRRYMGKGLEFADRIQEGNDGVIEAVDHFKWWLGFKFSSYATNWINQRIQSGIEEYNGKRIFSKSEIQRISQFEKEFVVVHGCRPTADQIASALGMSRSRVFELVDLANIGHPASYDKRIKSDDGELDTMRGFIPDNAMSVEDQAINVVLVASLLTVLDDREKEIIKLSYFDGLEDVRIAEILPVTRARVGQIRRQALVKMNKAFDDGIV